MKERYTIDIADVQMCILSDEPEEFVHEIVGKLDRMVRDLSVKNKRCSKLDAALLCAMDSLSEQTKAERHVKNLETQVSLLEATIQRLRRDIDQMQKAGAKKPAPAPIREILHQDTASLQKKAEEPEQVSLTGEEIEVEETPRLHDAKLKQIEALLRRRTESESTEDTVPDSRSEKLKQIEELLKQNGGSQSLSEALNDASDL